MMSLGAFFVLAIAGAIAGFCFEVGAFFRRLFCQKVIPTVFIDIICGFLIGVSFFLAEFLFLNFELHIYGLLSFVLGFSLERTTVGFLLAKFQDLLYNALAKAKAKPNRWLLK